MGHLDRLKTLSGKALRQAKKIGVTVVLLGYKVYPYPLTLNIWAMPR